MQFETDPPRRPENHPDRGEWHCVQTLESHASNELPSAEHVGAPDVPTENLAFEALIGERIVAVFRHQGQWYAIDAMCAHQGGPLAQGIVQDGCVTCPWHGWQYDLATGVQTINRQPLQQTYPVRQIEDRVEVFV